MTFKIAIIGFGNIAKAILTPLLDQNLLRPEDVYCLVNSKKSFIPPLLAVGAIAGGAPEAGNALILGGQHLSQANLLSFSRSQESYADQTSIRLLLKSGFSLNGMLDMFKLLEQNQLKRY